MRYISSWVLPYLTVRTEEVRMVNQDVVEYSGHFTKVATVNKKHCHYYLFDRLPQTLKNSATVQEYFAVELELRKTYVLRLWTSSRRLEVMD